MNEKVKSNQHVSQWGRTTGVCKQTQRYGSDELSASFSPKGCGAGNEGIHI